MVQIFVKGLKGETDAFDIDSKTIREVKEKWAKRKDIDINEVILKFSGKTLQDDGVFSDYGIVKESTLHAVLHMRGGGLRDNSDIKTDTTSIDLY